MAKVKPGMKSNVYSAENYRCQKCLVKGHFTYECTGKRKYVSRPNHTTLLQKKLKLEEKEGQLLNVVEDKGETSRTLGASDRTLNSELAIKKVKNTSSSSDNSDDSTSEDSESDSTSSNSSHSRPKHSLRSQKKLKTKAKKKKQSLNVDEQQGKTRTLGASEYKVNPKLTKNNDQKSSSSSEHSGDDSTSEDSESDSSSSRDSHKSASSSKSSYSSDSNSTSDSNSSSSSSSSKSTMAVS